MRSRDVNCPSLPRWQSDEGCEKEGMTQTNAEFFADIASKIDALQRLVELRRAQAKTYADADARVDWKASTRQMGAALLVESNLRKAAVRARWVAAGVATRSKG